MLVLAVAASAVICSRINSAPSEKTVPVYEKDRQKGKGRKSSRERGKRDLKLSSTWHRCKRVSLVMDSGASERQDSLLLLGPEEWPHFLNSHPFFV